jgi:hypothetical protein
MVLMSVAVSVLVVGCGGDDGGPKPVSSVDISADKVEVEIGHTTAVTATVTGGASKALAWSVNGIEKMDTCHVHLSFTKLFVDSANGDDETGTGCVNLPLRTITKALTQADSGMTVLVKPGTYSDAAGESFPMYIPRGVALVGQDWETCIIRKETAAFDGMMGIQFNGSACAVRKFTLRDEAPPGYARWYSAVYTGVDGGLIDSMRFFERGIMACIRIDRATNTVVQNCVLDVEMDIPVGDGMNRAFEIVFGDEGTIIRNSRVAGFNTGLFFNISSDALVEGCLLENNEFGAYLCCQSSETSNPNPDFGGGARGSTGGNTFRNNGQCGLTNYGASAIYAKNNIWDNDPPVAGVDYCNQGTGSIMVE